MTTKRHPVIESYPWDPAPEWNKPSAVYAASDRITATMFLRPTTPIEVFDRAHPDASDGSRVVGAHVGDLTFQFTYNDGDLGIVAATARLMDALTVLHHAAAERLVSEAPR